MRILKLLIILSLLLVASMMGLAAESRSGFLIEPYLLDVTENSAVVAFFLQNPLPACVRVFTTGRQIGEFCSPGDESAHFIEISDLEPGHYYTFEVVCGRGDHIIRTPPGDNSFQVKTACRSGEFFTFAVYGDPRPGDTLTNRHHEDVVDQVLLHEPAFNLVLGDMVDDGSDDKSWRDFFRIEAPLLRRSAIYPVIGDNDFAAGQGKYKDYFPMLERGYYRFDWGDAVFFALLAWDTRGSQPRSGFDATSPQYRWFEAEISKPEVRRAQFRVVFIHDPVYICRGRASEVLRHTWAPLFEKHRVDVVFASWHLYERSVHNGVTYVVSGGAGAELLWMSPNPSFPSQVDARRHHFCRVDLGAGVMNIRSIATDGTVLDAITLTPRGRDEENENPLEIKARRLGKEILHRGAVTPGYAPEVPLYLFSYDCSYCRRLLERELQWLAQTHRVNLRVFYYDLSKKGTYDLFLSAGANFGRQDADLPAIFIGRTVIGGEKEIEKALPAQLRRFQADPRQYRARMIAPFQRGRDTRSIGEAAFDALTAGTILSAGLQDGIKPCAFTALICLVAYLSLVGISRPVMLYAGGIFILAVFLAGLVGGLLYFNLAGGDAPGYRGIALGVNLLLLCVVAPAAVLAFAGLFKATKGSAPDTTEQLPLFLTKGIREKIATLARSKGFLTGTSFILGVVLAAAGSTCTGQAYIPIVTMIPDPGHRATAIYYLFLYNTAFIVPLLVLFPAVVFGLTWGKSTGLPQRRRTYVKLVFSIVFAVPALLILCINIIRWL